MPTQRDTSGDVAEAVMAGSAAYWRGEPLLTDKGGDWIAGWLAGAAEARRTVEANGPLLDRRDTLVGTLTAAYAALKQASGLPKLRPGLRNQLRAALVDIGTLLAHLGPSEAADTGHHRLGRA